MHLDIFLTILAALAYARKTVYRTARKVTFAGATLTLSIPGFVKLEIKTEPKTDKKPRPRKRGR